MPTGPQIKPTHKPVKAYYEELRKYANQRIAHEGAVRSAFQNLLAETGRKFGWTLIPELTIDANGHQIRPDGTFRDEYTIERVSWLRCPMLTEHYLTNVSRRRTISI